MDEDAGRPFVKVLQRHYLTPQRLDAVMEFDPRIAFSGHGSIKRLEEWVRGTFEAFSNKQANPQFGLGVAFRYGASRAVCAPAFARAVSAAWRAAPPVLRLLHDRESAATSVNGRRSRNSHNRLGGPQERAVRAAPTYEHRGRLSPSAPRVASRG